MTKSSSSRMTSRRAVHKKMAKIGFNQGSPYGYRIGYRMTNLFKNAYNKHKTAIITLLPYDKVKLVKKVGEIEVTAQKFLVNTLILPQPYGKKIEVTYMGSKKEPIAQNPKIYNIHAGKRGWSKKLLQTYGYYTVFNTWYEKGCYRTAREFGVTPWVINYVAIREGWKRPEWRAPSISKGVKSGKMSVSDYKTVRFSNRTEDDFLTFLRAKGANHVYTYVWEVFGYLQDAEHSLKQSISSLDELISFMQEDEYYTQKHCWKVRVTMDLFLVGQIE